VSKQYGPKDKQPTDAVLGAVKYWNEHYPIGTKVLHYGDLVVTTSNAEIKDGLAYVFIRNSEKNWSWSGLVLLDNIFQTNLVEPTGDSK